MEGMQIKQSITSFFSDMFGTFTMRPDSGGENIHTAKSSVTNGTGFVTAVTGAGALGGGGLLSSIFGKAANAATTTGNMPPTPAPEPMINAAQATGGGMNDIAGGVGAGLLGNMLAGVITGGNLGQNSTMSSGIGTAIGTGLGSLLIPIFGPLAPIIGGGLGGFAGSFIGGGETETQKHDRELLDAQKKAAKALEENTRKIDLLSQTYGQLRDITSQNLITLPASAYFSGRYAPAIANEAGAAKQRFYLQATIQTNLDGQVVAKSTTNIQAKSSYFGRNRG
jgi:hypothetical protein